LKEFYILKPDGTSLFELPYQEEFIYHCLTQLLDTMPDTRFTLLEIDRTRLASISLLAEKAKKFNVSISWSGGFAGDQSTNFWTLKAKK